MQSPLYIGIDVAKDELVIACAKQSFPVRPIPNQIKDIRQFLKSIPANSKLALEATGSYHEKAADLAVRMGHTVYVLNPKDTRYYAKAVGLRAKTDRVDAGVLARYLANEHEHLHAYVPPTAEQRSLDQLIKRRAKIVTLKTALRLSCREISFLQNNMRSVIQEMDALLEKIDRQLAILNDRIPHRTEQLERLQSIAGIGPLVGTWLANLLNRVPFQNSDALVAFTGLDPRPFDSGQKKGRRRLSKRGPAEGRRLLFNAAMAAAKTKAWAPIYQHYRELGWASTAALIIIARKLIRIAYALFKSERLFDPTMLSFQACAKP